ncbi:prepilin-type N-terminal cleavage/methylation domain-containing protein [Duganella sp. FT80W]|uniref:Prepilin-type N-terminal cleavage/methylation domain-containing protein n=1 Tax=Duganella guangzhouensis TaxID=2666084 RepID=A0A6I2L9U6_9BURK|nr:type II secretion system protein [Duganella guangzhouensis]MRW93584.1 prepilin-type N-terminal cleavage/methylation domain-containing protein [Duganella guangzhouensis]
MRRLSIRFGKRARGFTLVEAIIVMVLTAILASVMVLFIRRPVQSYIETSERADMADVAEIALRRMARELHGALPNSIRWMVVGNVSYLEFIPTKGGGIYLAAEDGADPAAHPPLSFTAATAAFEVVGPMPAAPYAIAANDYIVVYNLGAGYTNADAYAGGNVAPVVSVNGQRVSITSTQFSNASPGKRFQVAMTPVTFACSNDAATGRGTLTRRWGYATKLPSSGAQTVPTGGYTALMADNVYGCQFWTQQAANQNTALVGLSIALARANPDSGGLETVTLSQQIHVDNTP